MLAVRSSWFSVEIHEVLPIGWVGLATKLAEAGFGSLTLQTDSGAVTVTLAMAKKGELHVSVRVQQLPDLLHDFRCCFTISQSSLKALFDGNEPSHL